jgi:hypothetical protein
LSLPTVILPLPTATLPLPTLALPLLTATAPNANTPAPTAAPSATPTFTLTSPPLPSATATACGGISAGDLVVTASADAYVNAGGGNHGGDARIKVRADNGGDHRGLVQFDLSSIPGGSPVTVATLHLYQENSQPGTIVNFHRVATTWLEGLVFWLTSPLYDASPVSGIATDNSGDCVRGIFLPTSLVQGWVDAPLLNYGLMVIGSGSNGEVRFASREDGNPGHWPTLSVTYAH